MPFNLGIPELVVIFVIALLVFGPRKLPELGRSLGRSLGEFRKASNELKRTLDDEIRVEEQKEQRVKMEAEQASAIAAVTAEPGPGAEIAPSPETSPVADGATVSRTGTDTPA